MEISFFSSISVVCTPPLCVSKITFDHLHVASSLKRLSTILFYY